MLEGLDAKCDAWDAAVRSTLSCVRPRLMHSADLVRAGKTTVFPTCADLDLVHTITPTAIVLPGLLAF
jgi:inactivated superfamily I helicase